MFGPCVKEVETLVEDLMESLGETEQDTTLGLVAKEFTQTNKAHKSMFQVGVAKIWRVGSGSSSGFGSKSNFLTK